ncbi:hypothetical protein DDE83_005498 [Stemphylium lycopersici]|uniref:Rhodopsin domain-containing protein n=1 Tax=Stemphylium lycopersici TaxID=183478 RepID=A0A364N1E6_STELY|nr:hypothetical protein DDE83_005498 [Stemphylium lycopersici]
MTVVVWSLCAISAAFLTTRFLIKKTQQKLWLDDLLLLISWLILLSQAIVAQLSIELGFGKHALDIDISHFDRIARYAAVGISLSIGAVIISKISFGVTLLRLTESWLKAYVSFAIASLAIFAIPAAILPWVICKPITKAFLDILPGECTDRGPSITYGRFQAGYVLCNHGFFPSPYPMATFMGSSNAPCREGWSWHSHESRIVPVLLSQRLFQLREEFLRPQFEMPRLFQNTSTVEFRVGTFDEDWRSGLH